MKAIAEHTVYLKEKKKSVQSKITKRFLYYRSSCQVNFAFSSNVYQNYFSKLYILAIILSLLSSESAVQARCQICTLTVQGEQEHPTDLYLIVIWEKLSPKEFVNVKQICY